MATRDERDEPTTVDLSAVRADDALLDALGDADPKVAGELGEAELVELLLTWSRQVDSEPMPQLVDVDTAVTTVTEAARNRRAARGTRRPLLIPVAAAAAVLAITFSGASVAAHNAEPGDALWALTKVLYAEKASSVQASFDVQAEFTRAREALGEGDMDAARSALEKASEELSKVRAEENHDELMEQHQQLEEAVENGGDPSDEPDDPSATTDPSESSQNSTEPDPGSESSSEPTVPSTTAPPTSTTEPSESSTTSPSETSTSEDSSTAGSTDQGAGTNSTDQTGSGTGAIGGDLSGEG